MEEILTPCVAGRVYVTAFLDVKTFRKYAGDIARETEVWIADNPDHMIHSNGPKFLGPYPQYIEDVSIQVAHSSLRIEEAERREQNLLSASLSYRFTSSCA